VRVDELVAALAAAGCCILAVPQARARPRHLQLSKGPDDATAAHRAGLLAARVPLGAQHVVGARADGRFVK